MPQIFINGELIGGSDIAMEMYESGELQQMISDGKSE
jgi:monothiol glutaredoxin